MCSVGQSIVVHICGLKAGAAGDGVVLIKVGRLALADFAEYSNFHVRFAIPAGRCWDSNNVLAALELFRVFFVKKAGSICSSIFGRANADLTDICALFIDAADKG